MANFLASPPAGNVPDMRGSSSGRAAMALKMKPMYDEAVINGDVDPQTTPYEMWVEQQMAAQRGQGAQPPSNVLAPPKPVGGPNVLLRMLGP